MAEFILVLFLWRFETADVEPVGRFATYQECLEAGAALVRNVQATSENKTSWIVPTASFECVKTSAPQTQ